MKDRIIQIMRSAGLSNADFADKIGISTSSLSHIFSGRNNPSLDVVKRIHKAFPSLNLNWILYGEGNMYINDAESDTPIKNVYDDSSDFNQDNNLPMIESDENPENTGNRQFYIDFRKEKPSETPVNMHKETEKEQVRYIEKPAPKITEIRIFYDNGTFEVFKPDSK
ncbi:helix-turn-helix transcriptional regulator [Bacteroides caecigallinarum]|uniref:helix-turn-helix domain-containing protein n=1 Tax=Bacteroides caecigallinarum TaxID=1411144 RepID=UPI0019586B18|nr:helix-turn-helix domain-containing protein [Bacteroides caecigallinarum]MBM6889896.1 helix-turn-helix transcriptional regulator [Bacteroides caecigallinarum]